MEGVNSYQFSRITSRDTWPLRAAVLWPEKEPGSSCQLPSDDLSDTLHFGVLREGALVSIGSFSRQHHPDLPGEVQFRLRAMATHESNRKMGVGSILIAGAIAALSEEDCSVVWADARLAALGFYERLDWEVTGPTYVVPLRGPHRLVWRRI